MEMFPNNPTPAPRQLNSFINTAETIDAGPDQAPPPPDIRRREMIELGMKLWPKMWDAKERCVEARIVDQIDALYQVEETEFRCENKPAILASGKIDPRDPFAHRVMGITDGLFTNACTTIPAQMLEYVMGHDPIPVEFKPIASRSENDHKAEIVKDMAETDFSNANFHHHIAMVEEDVPKHGTGLLWHSYGERRRLMRQRGGLGFQERVVFKGPIFEHGHLLECFISNPERSMPENQDFVIRYSRQTLSDLLAQELVEERGVDTEKDEMSGMDVEIPFVKKSGKYVNLDILRDGANKSPGTGYVESRGTNTGTVVTDQTSQRGLVTSQATYDVYALQGDYPAGAMLRTGEMKLWQFDDLHAGLWENGALIDMEQAARMCDAVDSWFVTIAIPSGGARDVGGGAVVLQFEPCPYRERRNELRHATFIDNGNRFYGISAYRIGKDQAVTVDSLLNSAVSVITKNANANAGYKNIADDEVERLRKAEGGELVRINSPGDMKVAEAFSYFTLPFDPGTWPAIDRGRLNYQIRTMSVQSQQGGPGTTQSSTYSEYKEQINQAEKRGRAIMVKHASRQLIVPIFKNWLDDLWTFNDDEALAAKAIAVAGRDALDEDNIWATAYDAVTGEQMPLGDEFSVRHKGMSSTVPEVAGGLLIQTGLAVIGQPDFDAPAMIEKGFSLQGIDTKPLFPSRELPITADQEVRMIALGGDSINPDPRKEVQQLLMDQETYQIAIQAFGMVADSKNAAGEDSNYEDSVVLRVEELAKKSFALMQQKQAALMQQQAELMMAAATAEPQKAGGEPNAAAA